MQSTQEKKSFKQYNTNDKKETPGKGCMWDGAGWSLRLKELQAKELITKAVSQGQMLGK